MSECYDVLVIFKYITVHVIYLFRLTFFTRDTDWPLVRLRKLKNRNSRKFVVVSYSYQPCDSIWYQKLCPVKICNLQLLFPFFCYYCFSSWFCSQTKISKNIPLYRRNMNIWEHHKYLTISCSGFLLISCSYCSFIRPISLLLDEFYPPLGISVWLKF